MNIQCLYELIWKRTVDLTAKTNDRERQTESDHSSDIASLWTVTHQDGFCVWIRCFSYSHFCICPLFICVCETTTQLALYLRLTVLCVTYQDGNEVGTNYFVTCGVICIWHLWAGIWLSKESFVFVTDQISLLSLYLHLSPGLSQIKM